MRRTRTTSRTRRDADRDPARRWHLSRSLRVASRRTDRGYTIMEVAVVAVLTTAALIALLRWLLGLGAIVNENLQAAGVSTVARAVNTIASDVLTATHCDPGGIDPRVREVTATRLALVVGAGGSTKDVVWRINGAQLERGEATPGASCAWTEPTTWTVWTRDLDPASSSFKVVLDGGTLAATTGGACLDEWVSRCAVRAVDITMKTTGDSLVLHHTLALD